MSATAYLWAIVVLGLIVFIHELGHFVAAKATGMRVHEFALGFGPQLLRLRRGETVYSVRALLLGGFVRIAGMDEREADDPRGYGTRSVAQRTAVIAAGPLMNFVLAVAIFAIALAMQGEPRDTRISAVRPDYPAAAAGLQPGDRIVAINGDPAQQWTDLNALIQKHGPDPLAMTVERDGAVRHLTVTPRLESDAQVLVIGVEPWRYPIGTFRALRSGAQYTVGFTLGWFMQIGQMLVGRIEPDLAGPVGIVRVVAEYSQMGWFQLLHLTAALSINIGILNLLPFPALDGSRLAFLGLEAVRGRPIHPARENMIHFVGLVLLFSLMIIMTYSELML